MSKNNTLSYNDLSDFSKELIHKLANIMIDSLEKDKVRPRDILESTFYFCLSNLNFLNENGLPSESLITFSEDLKINIDKMIRETKLH